jgi:hypothetical protein
MHSLTNRFVKGVTCNRCNITFQISLVLGINERLCDGYTCYITSLVFSAQSPRTETRASPQ